jgi:hypothetical protein
MNESYFLEFSEGIQEVGITEHIHLLLQNMTLKLVKSFTLFFFYFDEISHSLLLKDISPLFDHWNTKQVFVYLQAEYSTSKAVSSFFYHYQ